MLTQTKSGILMPLLLLFTALTALTSCAVYTVDKTHLETKLKPGSTSSGEKGLGLNKLINMYKKQYNNRVDTLLCLDKSGRSKIRRLTCDSKITIITNDKRSLNFYAKTLYIWNGEYLIGERTAINLRRSNCCTVRLKDIARIEVRG